LKLNKITGTFHEDLQAFLREKVTLRATMITTVTLVIVDAMVTLVTISTLVTWLMNKIPSYQRHHVGNPPW
jgi:hypothetical protein